MISLKSPMLHQSYHGSVPYQEFQMVKKKKKLTSIRSFFKTEVVDAHLQAKPKGTSVCNLVVRTVGTCKQKSSRCKKEIF